MSEPQLVSWGASGGAWAVLVHGGAGGSRDPQVAERVRGCRMAAQAAAAVLREKGSALDAVERAVLVLEDDPCFNAGTGACLNSEGLVELDAAAMEGRDLLAGAVCALPPFKNPIAIARAVLNDGRHVLYAGDGAARFALQHGFVRSTSEEMTTDAARARWAAAGFRRRLALGGAFSAGLAVHRLLQATPQPLRAFHAPGLERGGQPLVTLSHVPHCTVRHRAGNVCGKSRRVKANATPP